LGPERDMTKSQFKRAVSSKIREGKQVGQRPGENRGMGGKTNEKKYPKKFLSVPGRESGEGKRKKRKAWGTRCSVRIS